MFLRAAPICLITAGFGGIAMGSISMHLEEFLVAEGMIRPVDLARAAERSELRGGRITDNLLALKLVTPEQIDAALQMMPPALPSSVENTGISRSTLHALVLKALYRGGVDSLPGLSEMMKLPSHVVGTLVEEAIEQKLLKVTGATARSTLPVLWLVPETNPSA